MRTALYIRVSTEEQAREGFSLQSQKALLERKSAELNLTIVDTFVDEGYSAKSMKRPAMQRMLRELEHNTIDLIFFWRLDRLTRRSKDFHALAERLQQLGVGIKSATEQIDTTTAIGRFQLELSVSLAQLERETIAERVTFVMSENARKGLRGGGVAPFGYTLTDDQKLSINESEAETVRFIFESYLTGRGMKNIAYELIRTSAHGMRWSGAAIQYILQNPVYTGMIRWNKKPKKNRTGELIISEGEHQPIIDKETFERTQEAMNRRKYGAKKFTSNYLFSSVLKCARCGSNFHGWTERKNSYNYILYRCGGKIDRGICNSPTVSEKEIIGVFLSVLDFDMDKLREFIELIPVDNRTTVDQMKKELEAIAKRRKKWQIAFANDVITLEELKEHTDADRKEEDSIKAKLKQMNEERSTWTIEEVADALRNIKEVWHQIDNNQVKKRFISEAFESIVIMCHPPIKGERKTTRAEIVDIKFR
jgi:site-specific DNA recombinase